MSRWMIEKSGTGIEKAGTGIEKAGTGIEKAGTGIEKSGTGIEKSPLIERFVFRYVLLPFHLFYANLLLKGMANQLEKETSSQEQNKKDK